MRPGRRGWSIAYVTVAVTVAGWSRAAVPLAASTPEGTQESKPPAPEFRGWKTETYGPLIVASDDDIQLKSTSGPAGMFFRRMPAADAFYRLTITGQSRSGQPTVRLTLGESKPQWFPAPDGQKSITFAGRQAVEVVVYGDTPYEYRLQDLKLDVCDDCAAAIPFSGWQVEPYGAVEWTSNARRMTLSNPGNPGGLFFRRATDPDKAYSLRIAGKPLSGAATVRLTIGHAEPRWFPAPDGTRPFAVSGSASIEVVVYGDAAYSYDLEMLTIDECAVCLTDRQLEGLILAEVPSLQPTLEADRKAAARALLNWTANIVDLEFGDDAEATTSREHEIGAAEAYQEIWSGDRGGTACAGFADFFAKVLSMFGFDAFTVDFGDPVTHVTHVTTVAVIEQAFYVLDPTFNGVYVDATSGAMLPVRSVLAKAESGDGSYEFQTNPIKRDIIFPASQAADLSRRISALGYKVSTCEPISISRTGESREFCRQVPFDQRLIPPEWTQLMSRRHLERYGDLIVSLMRQHVFSISATDQQIKQRFLGELTERGIPFGSVPY